MAPPPTPAVTPGDIAALAVAVGQAWERLGLTDPRDVEAAAIGAWWALVAACGDAVPSVRDDCAAAADRGLTPIAGAAPDLATWRELEGTARDRGYQFARDLLPPSAPGEPTAPAELPSWAADLRSPGDA